MSSPDYSGILKKSWNTTFKNKWLWVYGLVLAIFAGGFGSGGSSGNLGSAVNNDSFKNLPNAIPSGAPLRDTTQVLGKSINVLTDWISQIPALIWIVVGIGILIAILFRMIVTWVVTSWAKGALIGGLNDALDDKEVTLINTTRYGIASFKRFIIFSFLTTGIVLGSLLLILVVILFAGLLGSLLSETLKILFFMLTGFAGGVTFFMLITILAMVNVYADRLIALYGYQPMDALKKAYSISKGHYLHTILMGIINMVSSSVLGCLTMIAALIVLGIPFIIIMVSEFKNGLHFPSIPSFISLILIFILFLYTQYLVKAVLTVWTYGNWNLFFNEMTREEKL